MRQRHRRPRRALQIWAGVHDALGALQAERLGYDALWISSLGLSVARLGIPDAGFLEPRTVLAAVREIRGAVALPQIVDFENGYELRGLALTALAEEFFVAGCESLCMEDSAGLKRNSLWNQFDRDLADVDDMCERLGTLVEAAGRCGGSVVARTEALVEGHPVEEAIERVRRYGEAGCQAVVVHFRGDVTPVLEVAAAKEKFGGTKLIVIPTMAPAMRFEEFAEAGFDVYVAADVALRAASSAIGRELASVLSAGHQQEALDRIASMADLDELVRTEKRVWSAAG